MEKKEGGATNLDMDLELELGKKITFTQDRAVRVIKEPEME